MPTQIRPSDTYTRYLVPPTHKPAPEHIKKLLPKYRITHFLGAGGFADVYEGTDENGWGVAIKVPQFKMERTVDSTVLKKFASEADIWKKLHHENIVQIYDTESKPLPHIVMELMEGGDLDGLLKNHNLTVEEAVHVMIQILEAVSYAHRMATVHRDLKPENILFTFEGVAKITDWGIGKYMAAEGITKTMETKGTLAYSAPEQFDSKRFGKVDWQTDIFQLGVVFYGMLTGINPFEGQGMGEVIANVINIEPEPPSALNSDVPRGLDDLIMGALGKRKKDRWDSGAVMLHELRAVIEGEKAVKKKWKAKRGTEEKWKSKEILDDLEEELDRVEKIGVDTSGLKCEMKPIKKWARLRLYSDIIERGNVLLEELKKMYKKEVERQEEERKDLIEAVRKLLRECLSRDLSIEDLYNLNDEAMEAYESGNYNKADKLFRKLKEKLERVIDNDNSIEAVREEFDKLRRNSFGVSPPLRLKTLIEEDVNRAEGKLNEWRNTIDKVKRAEGEKRYKKEKRSRKEEFLRQRKEHREQVRSLRIEYKELKKERRMITGFIILIYIAIVFLPAVPVVVFLFSENGFFSKVLIGLTIVVLIGLGIGEKYLGKTKRKLSMRISGITSNENIFEGSGELGGGRKFLLSRL